MNLLTKTEAINASLSSDAKLISAHLEAAAKSANSMVSTMLSLNDEDLTAWLNNRTPQEIAERFEAHAQLGTALNTAIPLAASASGTTARTLVDVRPVADKLQERGRMMSFGESGFLVEQIYKTVIEESAPDEPTEPN